MSKSKRVHIFQILNKTCVFLSDLPFERQTSLNHDAENSQHGRQIVEDGVFVEFSDERGACRLVAERTAPYEEREHANECVEKVGDGVHETVLVEAVFFEAHKHDYVERLRAHADRTYHGEHERPRDLAQSHLWANR